jgi:putative endonuclease
VSDGCLDAGQGGTLRVVEAWFVYIAECVDGTLYVGVARDVAARIAAHDAGRGARYTRGRGPLQLLTKRRCATHGDALRLELALKRIPRADKRVLAASRYELDRFVRASRRAALPGSRAGRGRRRQASEPPAR